MEFLMNPLKAETFEQLILQIADGLILLSIPFIVVAFVYIGCKFIFSQGNPEELKNARQGFVYIIIAALVILGAKGIVEIVKNTIENVLS